MGVAQDFHSIHPRHFDVGNNHVEERAVDLAPPRFASVDGFYFVTIAAESNIKQFADGALVIADEDLTHAFLLERWRPRVLQRKAMGMTMHLRWLRVGRQERAVAQVQPAVVASQSSRLFQLANGPIPCPHELERSGRRWPVPDRYRLQNSTGKVRKVFQFAAD